jgi:hypothetical protein
VCPCWRCSRARRRSRVHELLQRHVVPGCGRRGRASCNTQQFLKTHDIGMRACAFLRASALHSGKCAEQRWEQGSKIPKQFMQPTGQSAHFTKGAPSSHRRVAPKSCTSSTQQHGALNFGELSEPQCAAHEKCVQMLSAIPCRETHPVPWQCIHFMAPKQHALTHAAEHFDEQRCSSK